MQTAKLRKHERGQSMAELAVALTFLLILVAGVVDLGRAFFYYLALRDAAQEGAVYGSIEPTDSQGIREHVKQSSNLPIDLANDPNVVVNWGFPDGGQQCAGYTIEVTVTYSNFPLTMPFVGAFVGSQTIPLSATIKHTILRPPC